MSPDPRHDVHAAEIERAVRNLQDALSRLEGLGQAPYPVGDPTGVPPHPPSAAGARWVSCCPARR